MNFNTDGFNERTNFIHNSNDKNRLSSMNSGNTLDSSFAKMKIDENKPNIQTASADVVVFKEEVRGAKENFVLRNRNIMNANTTSASNNPVSNAMNRNMFKKF